MYIDMHMHIHICMHVYIIHVYIYTYVCMSMYIHGYNIHTCLQGIGLLRVHQFLTQLMSGLVRLDRFNPRLMNEFCFCSVNSHPVGS